MTRFQHHPECFGCGQENATGLRLQFHQIDAHTIAADVVLDRRFSGPPGLIHGGVIATVLDEALAQWPPRLDVAALTKELSVRYERRVVAGMAVRVTARVLSRAGRTLDLEAELCETSGARLAYARARFEEIDPAILVPRGPR